MLGIRLACLLSISLVSMPGEALEEISVELTITGPSNINEGDILSLKCKVLGPLNNSTDKIVLQKAGKEVITIADDISELVVHDKKFEFFSETNSIGIFINGITSLHRGDYYCKVLRHKSDNNYDTIAEDSYTVNVHYSSNSTPSCDILPVKTTYEEEDTVTVKCAADLGYPSDTMHWTASKQDNDIDSALQNVMVIEDYGSTSLDLTLKVTPIMNEIVFTCVKEGNGDTNATSDKSCSIGPLEVTEEEPDSGTVMDSDDSKDTPVANGGMIGGIIAGIAVILIIVVVVAVVILKKSKSKESSKEGGKTRKTPTISGPVKKYGKVPSEDGENDDKSAKETDVEAGKKTTALPSTNQRVLSKTYPKAPAYPLPPKDPKMTKNNPYANLKPDSRDTNTKPEANETPEYADVNPSPGANAGAKDVESRPETSEPPEYATINPTGDANSTQQRQEDDEEVYDYPDQPIEV